MRRELREKGKLAPAPKVRQARRVAEREAEEHAASARVAEAREEVAHHEEEGEAKLKARSKQRDLTVLLLLGLTAIAAVIFYLSQRAPSTDEEMKPAPSATPTASANGETPR
jgi:hypothetical protein